MKENENWKISWLIIREGNSKVLRKSVNMSKKKGRHGAAVRPIDRAVLDEATQIRASYNLKTSDAIHAATALLAKCNMFLTNDPDFKRVPGLNAVILDEVIKL